ncbi:MAG: hypothetical protein Q4G16_00370 [Cruoricaptor ignavus]|nr:hypothetical protein [Cruoricaptor ignavus]
MTGITIYKRKSLLLEHFNTALYPNFPQFALIFSTFNNKNVKLYWLNDRLIFGSGKKKSYWLDNFMNVFIDDFRKTINNLPQNFNTETVDRVIRTHSVNTGILRYYKFINLRIENKWNYKLLKSRLSDIKKYSDLNIFILISLTLIPPKLLNFLYKIKTK